MFFSNFQTIDFLKCTFSVIPFINVFSTIGSPFGSMLMTSSGIILNNGMSAFSSPASTNKNGLPKSEVNLLETPFIIM